MLMSREQKPWIFVLFCIATLLGIAFFFVLPWLGMLMVAIFLLMSCIAYIKWTQEEERPPISTDNSSLSASSSVKSVEKVTRKDFKAFQARLFDVDAKVPESKSVALTEDSEIKSKIKGEEYTTESIQKQIADLETRVRCLRKQLKEDELSETEDFTQTEIEITKEDAWTEEDILFELAIKQLLDSLERKLAKRAISKQLYNRLHDKYLARLERAKQRRSTPSKWGTKEPKTGEQ